MHDIEIIEEYYKKCLHQLDEWPPEDFIDVDIKLLQRLNLLNDANELPKEYTLTQQFHYIESDEKITLINEDFIVWIVPENIDGMMITFTMISLNKPQDLHLELIFTTRGIYNTSNMVLRVLEKFLIEIQETEGLIKKMSEKEDK